MQRRPRLALLIVLVAGCGPRQARSSGDDESGDGADVPDLAEPTPDLPCGGADLQTDAENCGECGNVCSLLGKGEYEAGGCVDGACGPRWEGKSWTEPETLTCADVCVGHGLACQPDACAGLTGFVCEFPFDAMCATLIEGSTPLAEIEGSCANPLEWPAQAVNDELVVYCCCG